MMTQPVLSSDYIRPRGNVKLLRGLDRLTYGSAIGGALLMLVLLLLFLAVIGHGAWPAMQRFGLAFFTSTDWSAHPPHEDGTPMPPQVFGARTAITGTLATSFIALLIAFPVSLGSALFLTKLAPKLKLVLPRWGAAARRKLPLRHAVVVVSFMIELLAAIPSVAYGLWGVAVLVPFSQRFLQPFLATTCDLSRAWSALPHWKVGLYMSHWPLVGPIFENGGYGTNVLTAGLILSIMVTPIMTAIIRDVLAVTPPELEQGALGLGATWWQAMRMVLGFSKMGILGAVILGFARAIGETMAVTLVIGNQQDPDKSILAPGQSIASLLAVQFNNADTPGEIHALVYAAFVLLLITTLINGIARVMIVRVAQKGGRR